MGWAPRGEGSRGWPTRSRGVAVGLLVCAVFATIGALLVTDPTGAHLELAPLFVGAALALASLRAFRSRSRRNGG